MRTVFFVGLLVAGHPAHADPTERRPLLEELEERVMSEPREPVTLVAKLQQAVARRPDDPRIRLALAHELLRVKRTDEAFEQFQLLATHEDRALAAEAAAAIEELAREQRRQDELAKAGRAFVERFAGTPAASLRLAMLGQMARVSSDELLPLALAHIRAAGRAHLWDAVRGVLLTGFIDVARAHVNKLTQRAPRDAELRVLQAEIALFEGNPRATELLARDACGRPGFELGCFFVEQALATNERSTLPLLRMEREALAMRDGRTPAPATPELDQIAQLDRPFANEVARVLRDAERECAGHGLDGLIEVSFDFGDRLAPPEIGVGASGSRAAELCMKEQIAGQPLPAPPIQIDNLSVAMQSNARKDPVEHRPRTFELEAFAAIRRGATASNGVGAKVDLAFPIGRSLYHLVGAELEAGVNDGPTYVARGLAGIGIHITPITSLELLASGGVSAFDDRVPFGVELAAELRLRRSFGRARAQLSLAPAHVFRSNERMSDGASVLLGADEVTIGLGAIVPIGGRRLYLGGAFEHRVAGASGTAVVGAAY